MHLLALVWLALLQALSTAPHGGRPPEARATASALARVVAPPSASIALPPPSSASLAPREAPSANDALRPAALTAPVAGVLRTLPRGVDGPATLHGAWPASTRVERELRVTLRAGAADWQRSRAEAAHGGRLPYYYPTAPPLHG
ncbi:MAG TPA: hypothetical protein VFS08_05180 [Gemmatimonadaceae bacterium]|nr:hypothetical protein [Gemmatimonadaceae bacterium]